MNNKFKAWDTTQKKWLTMDDKIEIVDETDFWWSWVIGIGGEVLQLMSDFGIELVQYTGMTDKHDVECYHKDIIRRSDWLYSIEWHDNLAGWYLKPKGGFWHGITKGDMALMCEKVGNLYENPDFGGIGL